jgi:hypothetical protein
LQLVAREFTWTAVAKRSLLAYQRLRAGRAAAVVQELA